MRNLRIVFMGTPDFAVEILKKLLIHDHEVVGVITAPDKPSGRGRKLKQSAVKKFALENNLYLLQPSNLKSEEFISNLKYLNANLQVVVAFRMLPKIVWEMPKYGTFNLHASLLPLYRGAAPIHWAIINGENKTGVTTFFIDEKIDTGEIIFQKEIPIYDDEIVGDLHNRLMYLGADVVLETVRHIQKGLVKTQKQIQDDKNIKMAPKLFPENCKINWNDNLDSIYNLIRGLNPFPGAWSKMKNNGVETTVKIYNVKKEKITHNDSIGSIIPSKKDIKVAVKDGYIFIDEIKIPGKKKLDATSLLNGFSFSSDAKMH